MRRQITPISGMAALVATLLGLAPTGLAAAADPIVVNVDDRLPVTLVLDNPCTPVVEVIELSGELQVQGQVVFNPDGTTLADLFITSHLSGSDIGTGLKYESNDRVQVKAKFPAGAPLTFVARFLVISQTGVDNFFLEVQFRIGPNGHVTLDRVLGEECRG